MPAIDYMQLLREEKRKQRKKKKSQSSSSSNPNTNTNTKKDETTTTMTEEDEANDDEKVGNNSNDDDYDDDVRRRKGGSSTTTTATTSTTSNTTTASSCCNNKKIPEWSYPKSELEFSSNFRGAGGLKVICDNPKRISYCSPHTLFGSGDGGKNSDTTTTTLQKKLSDWLISLPSGNTGLNCWKTMKYGKRRVAMFGEKNNYWQQQQDDDDDDPSNKNKNNNKLLLPQPLQQIANQLVENKIFTSEQPPNHVLVNDYQPSQGILGHTDGPLYMNKTATISLNSDVLLIFTKRLTSNEIGSIGIGIGSIQNNQNNNNNNNNNKDTTTAEGTKNASSSTNYYSNEEDQQQQQQKSTKEEERSNNATDPPPPPPPPPASSSRSSSRSNNNSMEVLLEAGSLIVFEDDAYINYCHEIKMDVLSDITTSACLNARPGIVIPRRGRRFSLTFRHKPPPSPPPPTS